MKIVKGFMIRKVGDKTVAVAVSDRAMAFGGMITLNDTGRFIFECLGRSTTESAIVEALLAEYDIAKEQAEADVHAFLAGLRDAGLLEEDA